MLRVAVAVVLAIPIAVATSAGLPRAPEREPSAVPEGLPAELGAMLESEREAASLGRLLFHSRILSRDLTVACVNCHDPGRNFARNEKKSLGVYGRPTKRNVPTIQNRALGTLHMLDGRAASLEEQVLMPIEHPDEMDLPVADALKRLGNDPEWSGRFREVYGRAPDREGLAHSLAAFVRSQLVGDSPVDRFRGGDAGALTDDARQGLWLFESRGGCWRCHSGPNFSDERFHATGIGAALGVAEAARFAVTGDEADRGRFKTPTLRGLAKTAPYMHDGSLATLADVIEFYARGGNDIVNRDPLLEPLALTERDKSNLVAFLEALSQAAPPRAAAVESAK